MTMLIQLRDRGALLRAALCVAVSGATDHDHRARPDRKVENEDDFDMETDDEE